MAGREQMPLRASVCVAADHCFLYAVYGFLLRSNRPIEALRCAGPDSSPANPDVSVYFGVVPDVPDEEVSGARPLYESEWRDWEGKPVLTVRQLDRGRYYHFRYRDGVQFLIDRTGRNVWATWPPEFTKQDAVIYLLGPILGFVLWLHGRAALHASAVEIDGRAVCFCGPASAGKSTTAAAFALRGYACLADDVVAFRDFEGRLCVEPAHSRLSLWPSSVRALYGCEDALPRFVSNWDKRYLDLSGPGQSFVNRPLPLGAIYLLAERTDRPSVPRIEGISGAEVLRGLLSQVYASYVLPPSGPALLDFLARLAREAPVRRVVPSSDPARLPALCSLILRDFGGEPKSQLTAAPE